MINSNLQVKHSFHDSYLTENEKQVLTLEQLHIAQLNELCCSPLERLIELNMVLPGLKKFSSESKLSHFSVTLKFKNKDDFQKIPIRDQDFFLLLDAGKNNVNIKKNERVKVMVGMVMKSDEKTITLSTFSSENLKTLDSKLSLNELILVPYAYNPMIEKMLNCYKELKTIISDEDHDLNELVTRVIDRRFDDVMNEANTYVLHESLNRGQQTAIRGALNAKFAYLIHGPPGTGKSRVLYEIMKILVSQKKRVLFCSSTHVNTDNMVTRIKDLKKIRILRLGTPEKVDQTHIQELAYTKINVSQDYQRLEKEINKCLRNDSKGLKLDELLAEKTQFIEEKFMELVDNSDIVFTTINGSRPGNNIEKYLKCCHFDVVIIDEAAQVSEHQTWLSILNAPKFIMAGDDKQTRALFNSLNYSDEISISLFEKLKLKLPDDMKVSLNVQYRMNSTICQYPSAKTYEGKLICHESCESRTLKPLRKNPKAKCPILQFVNTDLRKVNKDNKDNKETHIGTSYCNNLEVEIVKSIIIYLLTNFDLKRKQIGVITPYAEQIKLVKDVLSQEGLGKIEVSSVDGFQGKEKEVIILTFVRANNEKKLGFVSDERRLNVSVTRAKRALLMVGSKELLSNSSYMNGFLNSNVHEVDPEEYLDC